MFKKFLFLLFFVNVSFLLFSQVGERHFEAQSDYSICPPKSWMIMPYPGQPLKTFVENAEYPGLMTFVSSLQPGSTAEKKWQDGKANLSRYIPNYKSISISDFTTSQGIKGLKHIYTQTAGGVYDQRVLMYIITAPNGRSVTINCGVLSSHGTKYDAAFDESVKTLIITY